VSDNHVVVQVIIEVSTLDMPVQLYTAFPSRLGVLPPSKRSDVLPLKAAEPADACSPLDASQYIGRTPFVSFLSQSSREH